MRWMVLLLAMACAKKSDPVAVTPAAPAEAPPAAAAAPAPAARATAQLASRSGSTVTGTVSFEDLGAAGVKVTIDLVGATPGDHAVHVHEKGDCSAPDGSSAGSHFNPAAVAHGDHGSAVHHPGDLGNVTVGADGKGHKELTTTSLSITEGTTLVKGLSVIVHEKLDDFSQPTGNAGGRQACGLIE